VGLQGLIFEERVVDLGALDPAEAEQRQRLRRDAEDVLEEDDAGRLVGHARVDLRWKSPTSDARRARARASRLFPRRGVLRRRRVAGDHGRPPRCSTGVKTQRELQVSTKTNHIARFSMRWTHNLLPGVLDDVDGLLELRRGHFLRRFIVTLDGADQ